MLRIAHPPGYGPEREYAVRLVLEEFLGLECSLEETPRQDVEITLPNAGPERRLLVADCLFRIGEHEWLTPAALPELPLDRWELSVTELSSRLVSPSLPILFGDRVGPHQSPFLLESAEELSLGLDVFGSAFFMLTRYEELSVPERDVHGRFPAPESLAEQAGFLRRPLVNEYVEVLSWALERLWPRLHRRRREFRDRPTHDVDSPLCAAEALKDAARKAVGDIARRRDPALAVRQLTSFAQKKRGKHDSDPCNTFDFIMGLSERLGLRSAFYFMAGGASRLDGTYSIEDPWIRGLLRRIDQRGHEIGLHPSYDTFQDPVRTQAELSTLRRVCDEEGIEQPIRGGRQHYLRWENPTTWQNWNDAGLEYDSTLGFADRPGFRCGVCFEYPVFNLRTHTPLRLRERPLIVMDRTLYGYMELSVAEMLDEIAELRRRCRLFDGEFTLLWHNSLLVPRRARGLYEDALAAG